MVASSAGLDSSSDDDARQLDVEQPAGAHEGAEEAAAEGAGDEEAAAAPGAGEDAEGGGGAPDGAACGGAEAPAGDALNASGGGWASRPRGAGDSAASRCGSKSGSRRGSDVPRKRSSARGRRRSAAAARRISALLGLEDPGVCLSERPSSVPTRTHAGQAAVDWGLAALPPKDAPAARESPTAQANQPAVAGGRHSPRASLEASGASVNLRSETPEHKAEQKAESPIPEPPPIAFTRRARRVKTVPVQRSATRQAIFQIRRRLCGQCPQKPSRDDASMYPRQELVTKARENLERMRKCMMPEPELCMLPRKHWAEDIASVSLPPLPEMCRVPAMSRRPHKKFPALSIAEHTDLELKVHQRHVREPLMKSRILFSIIHGRMETKRGVRDDLEVATLRIVVRKAPEDRSEQDREVLRAYLRNKATFQDWPESALQEVCKFAQIRRFEKDQLVWKEGQYIEGICVLIKGCLAFSQNGEPASYGVRRFAMRGQVLNFEEINQVCKPVFPGVADKTRHKDGFALHKQDAVAHELTEMIFCETAVVTDIVREQDQRTLMAVLHERFGGANSGDGDRPPSEQTRWSRQQSRQQSRQERRLTLFRHFNISDVPRYHTFHTSGERHTMEGGVLFLVASGEVQRRLKGRVENTVTRTSGYKLMLGDEVLYGDMFRCTTVATSSVATVVWIAAQDYLTYYLNGKLPRRPMAKLDVKIALDKKKHYGPLSPGSTMSQSGSRWMSPRVGSPGGRSVRSGRDKAARGGRHSSSDDSEDSSSSQSSDGTGAKRRNDAKVKHFMETLRRRARQASDRDALLQREWKTLQDKRPRPRPPQTQRSLLALGDDLDASPAGGATRARTIARSLAREGSHPRARRHSLLSTATADSGFGEGQPVVVLPQLTYATCIRDAELAAREAAAGSGAAGAASADYVLEVTEHLPPLVLPSALGSPRLPDGLQPRRRLVLADKPCTAAASSPTVTASIFDFSFGTDMWTTK
eukprot:TRINITY_DN39292_c0_g1_i1.p1 TRINITY_DN39292_c0_g1~~TRINITY_DN39292_c0_g1_i1.p1  ORF type:complete len:985 (+),score=183.90 TRINITY_DN39292_c0_g1_i1:264-3218(+)